MNLSKIFIYLKKKLISGSIRPTTTHRQRKNRPAHLERMDELIHKQPISKRPRYPLPKQQQQRNVNKHKQLKQQHSILKRNRIKQRSESSKRKHAFRKQRSITK